MSNKYEAEGTLRAILDTQQISDSFQKREFALEIEDGAYTQTVKFQVVQDKTALLDDFEVGQKVRIAFNLRGREYTRKSDGATDWWVNLDCWRIEPLEDGVREEAPAAAGTGASAGGFDERNPPATEFKDDDIPF
jgi:hypothetical protein